MTEEPRVLRWETLTKKAFDEIDRERAVVLVTASPLEVHGPHLPIGADALEGEGLAERMLRFLPEEHRSRTFLKLPFVYAATDVVPQPGSLFFRPGTTVRVLEDLGRSLAAQGFRHVWVSNFHGGPRHFLAIERACHRVHRKRGLQMASIFSLMISRLTNGTSNLDDVLAELPGVRREDLAGDTHGGLVETSQLLALHGGWVDPSYKDLPRLTVDTWLDARGERRARAGRGDPRRFLEMLGSFRSGLRFFQEETYSGAPGAASAELGERILDLLSERAAKGCAELLDGRIGPDDCHSPIWPYRFLFLNPLMVRVADRLLGFRNPIA
ncbi:MAG: creatininase family protein [Deltaproteobacteria bacterium]|nr:creatininase family protein [Deltaproteobacteria bacterium]